MLVQKNIERDYGIQPIVSILESEGLSSKDLVESSSGAINFKMVKRACGGRRLSPNVRLKVLKALNAASSKEFKMVELFNYLKPKS